MKDPKNKVIKYWSGATMRYRKDGKPDMRYKLGREISGVRKPLKRTRHKHSARTPEISLRDMLKLGLIVGLATVAIMLLNVILDPPNKQGFISPISTVALAKEKELTNFCDIDEVSKEVCMYDWDARKALAIAMAENGYLERHGWWLDGQNINRGNSVDTGVFQINSIHGYPLNKLVTIDGNVMYAQRVYADRKTWDTDGFNAWVVYKTDRYYQALELIKEYEDD